MTQNVLFRERKYRAELIREKNPGPHNPAESSKLPKRVKELAKTVNANVHRTPDGYYYVWRPGEPKSAARRAYSEGSALKLLRELEREKNPGPHFGPKEPYEDFARWGPGETRYVEDAEGRLWAGSPRGWSRIPGTRQSAERDIRAGTWKYRAELTREKNPTMKIKPEDYETLRAMLAGSGISSATTMRERWDALWRAKGAGEFINNKLYKYMNDDQIDTALRKIASQRTSNPGPRSVHTAKWDRCVKEVRKRGTAADPYAVCTAAMGEMAIRKPHRRTANPLPKVTSVRRIFYAVTASRGHEHLYLKRNGKLTRNAADAARFNSVNEATAKANAHLRRYPVSRAYRFSVGLAY